MKRAVLVALLAAVALPVGAAAQMGADDPSVWGPRFRFTPFVGQSPTVSRTERWTTLFAQGGPGAANLDVDLGAGPAAGAVFEVRLRDRFSVMASGTYFSRGRTREVSLGGGDIFESPGSKFIVAKAALAMRLREPISELQFRQLSASVFAGPAYIHERPRGDLFSDPLFTEPLGHWGAAFGLEAEIPLGSPSLALQAGFEDVVVWWNTDELAQRADAYSAGDGFSTSTVIRTDPSHMLLFRVGVSLRVH